MAVPSSTATVGTRSPQSAKKQPESRQKTTRKLPEAVIRHRNPRCFPTAFSYSSGGIRLPAAVKSPPPSEPRDPPFGTGWTSCVRPGSSSGSVPTRAAIGRCWANPLPSAIQPANPTPGTPDDRSRSPRDRNPAERSPPLPRPPRLHLLRQLARTRKQPEHRDRAPHEVPQTPRPHPRPHHQSTRQARQGRRSRRKQDALRREPRRLQSPSLRCQGQPRSRPTHPSPFT